VRIVSPDRSLLLSVMYSVEGNKLSMMMKYNIASTMFIADRYEEIRTFFDNVVAKENEQIVIRQL